MKSYLRNWLIYIGIVIVFFIGFALIKSTDYEKMQIMNNLDYEVSLNEDGSMYVVETWDVYVKNTGTLFKDFENNDKFPISDVSVKNLSTNGELRKIDYEIYSVPTGSYYVEDIGHNTMEVAFGTGMGQTKGNIKYQISYKIDNVINTYKDCQEFYWQFLSEANTIPCKKVTGKIKLPRNVNDIENLKIWGHGNINGDINRISTDEVEFNVNNFDKGNMLEVRVVITNKMFNSQTNNYNYSMLDSIIREEDEWAYTTNNNIANYRKSVGILMIIYLIIFICIIINFVRYYKISKQKGDGITRKKLKYFRDIPRDGSSTPGEAAFLYYFTNNFKWTDGKQADVVAANILNLCLKGYIILEKEKNNINIAIAKPSDGLKNDEKEIYELIKDAIGSDDYIEVKQLKKFAKEEFNKYSKHVTKMVNNIKKNLYEEEMIDKKKEKLYTATYSVLPLIFAGILIAIILYNFVGILPVVSRTYIMIWGTDLLGRFLDSLIILLPISLMLIALDRIRNRCTGKIYKLTQKGADERAEWKGLARYLEDYSMIDEKSAFDIVIWEKYLVYATAFGSSDKVIEELHAKYPYVFTEEYWQGTNEIVNTKGIIDMACNPIYIGTHGSFSDFTGSIHNSYRTMTSTISAQYSSSGGGGFSSGSGGGFSSGGGGRRRRTVGMGGR